WCLSSSMLTWTPERAKRHPEWLVVQKPGDKSRPKPEEVSDAQKAFTNTVKPDAPRRPKDGRKPAGPASEDKGYRAYLWQFCIGREEVLKAELDLIPELVSTYEMDGGWPGGRGPAPLHLG